MRSEQKYEVINEFAQVVAAPQVDVNDAGLEEMCCIANTQRSIDSFVICDLRQYRYTHAHRYIGLTNLGIDCAQCDRGLKVALFENLLDHVPAAKCIVVRDE